MINLCLGLDRIGVPYRVNMPYRKVRPDDWVGVLGRGRTALAGYDLPNPIVAGIGLMTHPSEWPTLFDDYPVAFYLQHSEWARDVYVPAYGADRLRLWPVGIDTEQYRPSGAEPAHDVLLYNKTMWEAEAREVELVEPIRADLAACGLSVVEFRYGSYEQEDYQAALRSCRAMVFLCEHESQGIAYQEALSSGVPILAWDQGQWLDPNRFGWGAPTIPATSVPFWDDRCGMTFRDATGFAEALGPFWEGIEQGTFAPRDYILDTLTLERSAAAFVDLLREANA